MDFLPPDLTLDPRIVADTKVEQSDAKLKALAGDWSHEDVAREVGYMILHGRDWAQTRTIAKNPQEHSELNPILGEHPSTGKVNNYFLATGLGHIALAHVLGSDWRKYFQYGTIGLEAVVTQRNKQRGIGMTF